jgi:hypothetical protein
VSLLAITFKVVCKGVKENQMQCKLLKAVSTVILSVFFFGNVATAALIEHNGYTRDDTTSVVFGPSSQWLTFDVTVGKSVDWYLAGNASNLVGGGWRLASNDDVLGLFNDFFANPWVTWDATETFDTGISSLRPEDIVATDWFISLFGVTNTIQNFDGPYNRLYSVGYYGSDLDNDGFYKSVNIQDGNLDCCGNFFGIQSDRNSSDTTDNGVGLVLVRDLGYITPPVEATAPSTLAIFGLGLIGLASRRFKKQA